MTAIAQGPSAFATTSCVTRDLPKYCSPWMAGLCMMVAFAGFTPSYWAPVATGSFTGPPIFHIHGLLFSLWTVFFVAQAALVSRREPTHDGRFPRQGEARFRGEQLVRERRQIAGAHRGNSRW